MEYVYDVIVVGAGSAGLSVALNLGCARRSTLLIGAGEPRTAPADNDDSRFVEQQRIGDL